MAPLRWTQQVLAAVALQLGHVVGHVVDQRQAAVLLAQDAAEDLAGRVGDGLAVGEGEVGRRAHGAEVLLPLRRGEGRAGQLAVRQLDAVARHHRVHAAHVVRADLVAEAAGAGVDEHRELTFPESQDVGRRLVEDAVHLLHLDEVVAGADRAELPAAPLPAPARRRRPDRRPEESPRPRWRRDPRGCEAALGQKGAAFAQDPVELGGVEAEVAPPAHARGDRPREIADERLQPVLHLPVAHLGGEEADAAVDVIAHAARRDDAVAGAEGGHSPDRKPVALVRVGHGVGEAGDSGQCRDVDDLQQRAVAGDLAPQLLVRPDVDGHAHVRAGRGRHLHQRRAHAVSLTGQVSGLRFLIGFLLRLMVLGAHTSKMTSARKSPSRSSTRNP